MSENLRVIVVGAGLAGIATGVALKTRLNFHNFTIFEKADDVGGTWRDSTYPGCACDVPAHWYSLSTELNPSWDRQYASQGELHAYWQRVWEKHSLRDHTQFRTAVTKSAWDEDTQRWTVWLHDFRTGEEYTQQAEVLVYAIGGFMSPVWPKEIQGLDKFKGDLWHSAAWRHDVDLKGKRVGAIGNGCSAAQFVPAMAQDPSTQVINFCRTPQWFVPKDEMVYPSWIKWVFSNVPGVVRMWRGYIMARSDISFLAFNKNNEWLGRLTRKALSAYIKKEGPEGFPIPDYAPGCKRIIVDPGYLACLKKENASARWDPIDSVVEEGIKMQSGELVPLDAIVFGTGYSIDPVDWHVQGRKCTMHEYYLSQGCATAYLGAFTPGFPNMVTLLGPNVATGHASAIFSEESQIHLAINMIRPIIEGQITSFDIKEEICDEYNGWLQNRLRHSVWTDCRSYYHTARDSSSKIIATFPGPVALFWWFCRRPRWSQWEIRGASKDWDRSEVLRKVSEFAVSCILAALFGIPWSVLS